MQEAALEKVRFGLSRAGSGRHSRRTLNLYGCGSGVSALWRPPPSWGLPRMVRDVPGQVAPWWPPQASASSCQQAAETQRKNVALPPAPVCLLSTGTKGGDGRPRRHGDNMENSGAVSRDAVSKVWILFSDAVFLPDESDCTRSVEALIPLWASVLLLSQPPVYKRLHCPPPVLLFSPEATTRRKHPQRSQHRRDDRKVRSV